MIFSKFYYYTSIAATQYILGIRYIACRLQRWAWSKANNLIFRCFQWEPIIIVVSRVPRLPTGPYRLIQTKCQKGHRPTSVFACIFKNFVVLFMFPDDFSSIRIMAKSGCFGMIQIHDLRILKSDLDLPTLASQALQIWKWNILKYCDFVGGGHEKDFCNCAISRNFDKHCLHTSCLSRTARHWSGSTLCGRDSFFLDSGSEQRLIRKWP